MDSRHFNVFFATYRAFAEPINVLDRLLRRYESLENEVNSSTSALVIQNSIRSILICWLDMYPEDFYDPDCDFSMLTNLLDFGQRSRLSDLRAKSRKLLERFKHIQEEGGMIAALPSLDQLASAFGYDASEYSRNPQERVKMFDVGNENCVQIAEQLTFWDAELFRELIIHQCQGCVWSKRHRLPNEKVYTVKATIDQVLSYKIWLIMAFILLVVSRFDCSTFQLFFWSFKEILLSDWHSFQIYVICYI
ncbi:unnamed protein product [Cylicostephanus goldi]|uniref:N-terminal Ras-GEF domain-containing protein n=1 Tax=Cylicostephanus goldi TaxID=71465 RepID=A0A3P6TI19_CYLGO|nr:unnamed protein product [Cylicostephanus goldi]